MHSAAGWSCPDRLLVCAPETGAVAVCYTEGVSEPGAAGQLDAPDFWLKRQLGFEVHATSGRAVTTIDCDERHLNPHGSVHGAVVFALVDTGMGAATMTVLPRTSRCATIEIQTRFLAPVFGGALRAEVEVVKAGRRVVHLQARVTDGSGALVALAGGSFAVIPAA